MKGQHNPRVGRFITTDFGGETVRTYLPPHLPPHPPLKLGDLQVLLEQANRALGRLDALASFFPNLSLFIYLYVRKEAVLSSQIEGTQSSLSDLLLFESHEAPGVAPRDVEEVSRYVQAMTHGIRRLRDGLPLSLRLMREIHGVLLNSGRGSDKQPGEFRTSQNWIGGTRPGNATYVPPPADHIMEYMGALEKFFYEDRPDLPLLIKAGLIHLQFESIHPFLDGNGRLGRLLITFLLYAAGALQEPILYLSLYLKVHRKQYYELLDHVRVTGDWEAWLEFFLTGIRTTADQAAVTARRLLKLIEDDRAKVSTLGRRTPQTLRVFEHLQRNPFVTIPATAEKLGITPPTVAKSFAALTELGILKEMTGRQRWRLFAYDAYVAILNEGTESASSS
jgi:Fic family protein